MASIIKRGDLQWQAKVRVKGSPAQSKTFSYKADAERWSKETEIAIERGIFFSKTASEKNTISDLIKRYRQEELPKKKGKHFSSALNQLESVFGEHALASVTSEMIARHRDDRLKTVSKSTVKKEINLLSSIIDLAGKEWGIPIQSNPCLMVKRPVEANSRDRRLEEGEEKRLLLSADATSVELVALIKVALETGARLGELLNLKWADINVTKRIAKLRDTKNGDTRTIPLSSVALSSIANLPRHMNDNRVFYSWKASDSFNKTWVRVCKRAEIEDLKFHDLRHEAVSRLFEKGLNPMEVASISGHKTLAMLKRYTHLRAEDLAIKLG